MPSPDRGRRDARCLDGRDDPATPEGLDARTRDALFPHWCASSSLLSDEHLLAVDKPHGVPVHAADDVELCDLKTRILRGLGPFPAGRAPTIVHGLDREASGVVVLALSREAARSLARELEAGARTTHVVAVSELGPFSGKHGAGKRGVTRLGGELPFSARLLAERNGRALVAIESAARKLELRKTLATLGAPIAGDRDHGGAPAPRLLWHVHKLAVTHPGSGRPLALEAPMPRDFDAWLAGDDSLPAEPRELDRRLRAAALRRYALARRDDTDALRLVHGAGDALPGVALDLYAAHAVLSLSSPDALALEESLLDCVMALGVRGVYLKRRPKQASRLVDTRRSEVAPPVPMRGEPAPEPLVVRELGVAYLARLGDGLSTGIFLDQLRARALVREKSRGLRVLNLFSYHAAFTVAALAGGAVRTVSVDASGASNARALENLSNAGASAEHAVVKADAAAWLESTARAPRGERFDLVVLDPPSFATTKSSTFRAERDMSRLAELAFRCLAPGGALLASTNLRALDPKAFARTLRASAQAASVHIERVVELGVPLDFPPAPGEPPHLKSALCLTRGA